ncbi:hypothetical protein SAMN05443247_05427 [Bradyrhizobium erythrophlei]|nr:hypothetical protein SAMN05443247_01988 [Bradyrhizobium erythrophlei]SIO44255.1 hypothetical protein SAMN05443247_05427 [Bradyrhizobium erythrophlei]
MLGTAIAGDSWRSWRALLIAAMGEELREDERAIFTKLTGREHEPLQRIEQFAGVVGRRGGKSKAIATVATYIAGLCDHRDALVPGERGVLLCVALDQRVAKIILDFASGNLPLGYKMNDGKIAIVEEEAELVRSIFRRYLERCLTTPDIA